MCNMGPGDIEEEDLLMDVVDFIELGFAYVNDDDENEPLEEDYDE